MFAQVASWLYAIEMALFSVGARCWEAPEMLSGQLLWRQMAILCGSGGISFNNRDGALELLAGRRGADPSGGICIWLLVNLLVAAHRRSEPDAKGRRAVAASVNKARVFCRFGHGGFFLRFSSSGHGGAEQGELRVRGCDAAALRLGSLEASLGRDPRQLGVCCRL
jgi:hypothetical protein